MRLVVDKYRSYAADFSCSTAREGQRILNERPISVLYIGHHLAGRGTGLDVLKWAKQKHRLPLHVMLTTNNPLHRQVLSNFLTKNGYVGDGTFFHKTVH